MAELTEPCIICRTQGGCDVCEDEERVDYVSLRQIARLSYLDGLRARSQNTPDSQGDG